MLTARIESHLASMANPGGTPVTRCPTGRIRWLPCSPMFRRSPRSVTAATRTTAPRTVVAIVAAALSLLLTACGGTAPDVGEGADPALIEGRSVWIGQCASCHGASGGGGRGTQLNEGRVLDRFPEIADQITLVTEGRGGMPGYAGRLSDEQIEAVVRYTREILNPAE